MCECVGGWVARVDIRYLFCTQSCRPKGAAITCFCRNEDVLFVQFELHITQLVHNPLDRIRGSYQQILLYKARKCLVMGSNQTLLLGGIKAICDSTYRKVPVVRKPDFELWRCKFKISQNNSPKVNFEISHTLESSILNPKIT